MKKQAGNYYVHLSEYDDSVSVVSRATDEIVVWDTKWTRKSERLARVRDEFEHHIDGDKFILCGMNQDKIEKLIKMLK